MIDIDTLEKFMLFAKSAQTRNGVIFSFDSFVMDTGKETIAKGKIFQKGSSEAILIPVEIEWDLKGNALSLDKQYDLIIEDAFEDAE